MNHRRTLAALAIAALAVGGYLLGEHEERRAIANCAASRCPPGEIGQRDSKTDTEPPVCWCIPDGGGDDGSDGAAQRAIAERP